MQEAAEIHLPLVWDGILSQENCLRKGGRPYRFLRVGKRPASGWDPRGAIPIPKSQPGCQHGADELPNPLGSSASPPPARGPAAAPCPCQPRLGSGWIRGENLSAAAAEAGAALGSFPRVTSNLFHKGCNPKFGGRSPFPACWDPRAGAGHCTDAGSIIISNFKRSKSVSEVLIKSKSHRTWDTAILWDFSST